MNDISTPIAIGGPYFRQGNAFTKKVPKEGNVQLTNFVATIDAELIYHDGPRTTTILKISGALNDNADLKKATPLPQVQIDATELKGMAWVSQKWGVRPIIYPQPGAERDIATILQLVSHPTLTDIYTHVGWDMINGKDAYLSASGAITKSSLLSDITVQLPSELQLFALPKPTPPNKPAALASLKLVNLGPKHVMWPLLLATYRAPLGKADFAIHVAGRTGTFKTELAALMQSHFGPQMDARHIPASWNSTANALEALAYKAKDALLVIDDYVPIGSSWNIRNLAAKADQVLRAQGNQAGRTRLTDTAAVQGTMYPRGIILSTGEDIPEGHSVRGRMLITELTPGDIPLDRLNGAQNDRPMYAQAMADFVQWLAGNDARQRFTITAQQQRDKYVGTGHTRTPSIIGQLISTAYVIGEWCIQRQYLTADSAANFVKKATEAIVTGGQNQQHYLQSADPVNTFTSIIRMLMATQKAHARTKNDGIPSDSINYGWTKQETAGEIANYKANGPQLGWVDAENHEFLFDPNMLPTLRKHADGQLAITTQTFVKRLKDSGIITRTDAGRQRNTVRMTLSGHPRNVVALKLDDVMTEPA